MTDFKKDFTAAQVGTIVESIEGKLKVVAEGVTSLGERMDRLEEDVQTLKEDNKEIKERLVRIEDAVRIAIPDHEKRISKLEKIRS